jgi:hypothetical protein
MNIRSTPSRQCGYATIMMLGLVALLLVVAAASSQIVRHLGREVKRVDDLQTQHWKHSGPVTNRVTPSSP